MSESQNPTKFDSGLTLRDRIAAVVCDMDSLHAKRWSLDVADAVIEALGLRVEWGNLDDQDGGVLSDTRSDVEGYSGAIKVRLVTEWAVDDE
jgi:hypothetical protein